MNNIKIPTSSEHAIVENNSAAVSRANRPTRRDEEKLSARAIGLQAAELPTPLPSPMLAPSRPRGGCAERQTEEHLRGLRDYIEVLTERQLRRMQNPYEQDPHLSSVVSYPQRCDLWGDAGFHGNCDGGLFKELVQRYEPRSVADPMMGSGTTRDVVAGLNRHLGFGIRYWGSDLAEGFNVVSQPLPGRYDLVWVHPPYWNIVRYSDSPADLSNCTTYEEFRSALRAALRNCVASLTPGGWLAVLVGDVRRAGRYIPIVRDLLNWEGELGELRSIIIKAQHNCRSNAKTYSRMSEVRIQHEYCVVYRRTVTAPMDPLGLESTSNEEGPR